MKSVKKRIFCFIMTAVLLLTGLLQAPVPAQAAYENTYVNTGDQRADLIGVALTQVGYTEGKNNYTKYGVWYGAPNTAWCGMFISWCANQAGIPTSVLKKTGFASASSFGISTYYAKDKTPQPGDLLFKTNNSHVGIVYYVEGDYVYTIEGNTSTTSTNGYAVMIRRRALSGSYYFGAPKYQSDSKHNYVKKVEDAHPHKEYYQCTDCGSKYYTGKTVDVDGCKQCLMENCKHVYGQYTRQNDTYHTAVCKLCGYETSLKHNWGNDEILKEATCKSTGSKKQTCTQCQATRTVTVPKTQDHQYEDWEFIDADTHSRVCKTCGHTDTTQHTMSQWGYDEQTHWYICADCGGRVGTGDHERVKGCNSACSVCGYKNPDGHAVSGQWSFDGEGHWYDCLSCQQKVGFQTHDFSAECDETCDICGYTRQTEHTFDTVLSSDATGHWYACTKCGQPHDFQSHIPGDAATENYGQYCTVCGFELAGARAHVHSYAPYESDALNHWGVCPCGHVLQPQAHEWDMQSKTCRICGAAAPVIQPQPELPWHILLPSAAGGSALLAVLLGIFALRKRKKNKLAVAA